MHIPRFASIAVAVIFFCGATGARHAEVGELGWMSGHWCAGSAADRIEEHWLSPDGGVLLGVSRTLQNGRLAEFEFLRIIAAEGVTTYMPQPGGRPPVAFRATAGGPQWVRFENPQHDFPQRIEYRREGDALHAQIAGPDGEGKESVIRFDYRRCRNS